MNIANVLKYSGLSAKIKAMYGKLFKADDYDNLIKLKSVKEVVSYLKATPSYSNILKDKNEDLIHRDELERLLKRSLYLDYSKLHKFVGGQDRQMLKIFFIRFEVDILKYLLQLAMAGERDEAYLQCLPEEYQEHSSLNILRLTRAQTVDEIIMALENTPYSKLIASLYSRGEKPTLFDLETALDIYYYSLLNKSASKLLSGDNRDEVNKALGQEADILNLLWIYRSKQFYHMQKELIYGFLIPVHYRLSRQMLVSLIEAGDGQEVFETAKSMHYGDVFEHLQNNLFERQMLSLIYNVYLKALRANSYNLVSAMGYLMAKEIELENIFSITEGIRYSMPPEQIKEYFIRR